MAKAHVDPDDLVKFAKSLNQFNRTMQEMTGSLKGQMRRLETTWQDQEQAKFSQEFFDALRFIDRFVDANDQHAQLLVKKARLIEAYLDA
ncbi:MAG: WXG100 family type VII secretion target [Planctomycetota bacterium]